jgi:hypothetical protein
MNFKRLLKTKVGIIFISIMLGLGLAVLFRKACNGKDCLSFKGPSVNDINGKTYQFGDSCYKYNTVSGKCDDNKQTLEFTQTKSKEGLDPSATPPNMTNVPTTNVPTTNVPTTSVPTTSVPTGFMSGSMMSPTIGVASVPTGFMSGSMIIPTIGVASVPTAAGPISDSTKSTTITAVPTSASSNTIFSQQVMDVITNTWNTVSNGITSNLFNNKKFNV